MLINLEKLREEIDQIDEKLLKLLAYRFKVTQKVGEYKKAHSLTAFDSKREKEVFQKRDKIAKKLNLDKDMIRKLFQIIIEIVKVKHRKIAEEQIKNR